MENQSQNENIIDFERLKRELHESDFDGHTSFQSMSFTQKLAWLSEAEESFYILKKGAPRGKQSLEETAYLLRRSKNAVRITEAIEEIEAGKAKERKLIE